MQKRTIDVLSVGELLVDVISSDFVERMDDAENFKRIAGGSPANLAMNLQRLGASVRLVAAVGDDDLGDFLVNYAHNLGLNTELIQRVDALTTLILVTRSRNVSNFEAYRGADAQIPSHVFTDKLFQNVTIFHTTCFALSIPPAQQNILEAAKRGAANGCTLSIDVNYSPKIWKNRAEAQAVVRDYVSHGALVKISEVDFERLFGYRLDDPQEAAQFFLSHGAAAVCVTLGGDGCLVADADEQHFLPARKVDVRDTTGAGDAFWSGFLAARLDRHSLLESAKAGRRMAELKLGHFGPLPALVQKTVVYEDF
jgi:sugar/nucleoside kinase (ribokinase family)